MLMTGPEHSWHAAVKFLPAAKRWGRGPPKVVER
jgi:hypothetical protein